MSGRAELRARVYAVLSVSFSPPREGMGVPSSLSAAIKILREALRGLAVPIPEHALGSMEEWADEAVSTLFLGGGGELEAEYNRLFVGPGPPRVYPYESLYQDSTGLVMGPAAEKVIQAYRRSGLMINGSYKDLPDHIAVELEFMARLCQEEAQAESTGKTDLVLRLKDEQRSFLRSHLAAWLPELCRMVIRESTSLVYRDLAEIAATFVVWDREQVDAERRGG